MWLTKSSARCEHAKTQTQACQALQETLSRDFMVFLEVSELTGASQVLWRVALPLCSSPVPTAVLCILPALVTMPH